MKRNTPGRLMLVIAILWFSLASVAFWAFHRPTIEWHNGQGHLYAVAFSLPLLLRWLLVALVPPLLLHMLWRRAGRADAAG